MESAYVVEASHSSLFKSVQSPHTTASILFLCIWIPPFTVSFIINFYLDLEGLTIILFPNQSSAMKILLVFAVFAVLFTGPVSGGFFDTAAGALCMTMQMDNVEACVNNLPPGLYTDVKSNDEKVCCLLSPYHKE